MRTPFGKVLFAVSLAVLALSACAPVGRGEPTAAPGEPWIVSERPALGFSGAEPPPEQKGPGYDADTDITGSMPLPAATPLPGGIAGPVGQGSPRSAGQMIIKHADLRLLVADTDTAIDRATQAVGDVGGYIISSRVWYQDYYQQNLKYATFTIGVPADQFEHVLSRMRDLSVRVLDEVAAGDDVTEQFVDLQSQLTNLEVTRERIKSFLDQAKTVDEALRINQQLSEIERQIEEIRGQMNYLSDRAAYSTITINFEPEFPQLTPTPTATPTATPTPRPWKPEDTLEQARRTVTYAYQGLADLLIWLVIVVLPLLAPPVVLGFLIWRMLRRRPRK